MTDGRTGCDDGLTETDDGVPPDTDTDLWVTAGAVGVSEAVESGISVKTDVPVAGRAVWMEGAGVVQPVDTSSTAVSDATRTRNRRVETTAE